MLQTNPISSTALPRHSWSANLAASLSGISEVWRKLWPYVWPSGRRDLQMRMYATFALLIVGKLVTVACPYAFKWGTDELSVHHLTHHILGWVVGPLALTLLYGLMRIIIAALTQALPSVLAPRPVRAL